MPDQPPNPFWTFQTLEKYVDARLLDLQGQIDRRIQTQQRELHDAVQHMTTLIDSGDAALTKHIADQLIQVREALVSARRETDIRFDSSQKAIDKAEVALHERLREMNNFRQQIEAERATYVTRDIMASELKAIDKTLEVAAQDRAGKLPLTTFEATVREWTAWREQVNQALASGKGQEQGVDKAREVQALQTQLALMRGSLAITAVGVVVTVVLAANGVI